MHIMGVLGGLGPQATMDFEARVHRVSQRLIPQRGHEGYPPMVVYYFRESPVLMPAPGAPPSSFPTVNPSLLAAAHTLGGIADFLVITSNGMHMAQEALGAAAGRPIVSMIDATVAEVQRRGLRSVGVADFRPPGMPATVGVYQPRLALEGITCHMLPDELNGRLFELALAIDEGRHDETAAPTVLEAINAFRAQGADGIILGCTEFPLALDPDALPADVINPAALLAEVAVRYALAG